MADSETVDQALSGPVGVLVSAFSSIFGGSEDSLTFGRGVLVQGEGFVLREIDESLTEAQKAAQFVETRPAVAKDSLLSDVQGLVEGLEGALDFVLPQSFPLPDLLEKLADLLLKPSYDPSKACLAPAPLLRDLLDLALGRITGGIDAIVGKVGQTIWDVLTPAGAQGEELDGFVESILADPVTAALNWILGKRGQIDCVATGSLSVGESVLETVRRRLEEALGKVLA